MFIAISHGPHCNIEKGIVFHRHVFKYLIYKLGMYDAYIMASHFPKIITYIYIAPSDNRFVRVRKVKFLMADRWENLAKFVEGIP